MKKKLRLLPYFLWTTFFTVIPFAFIFYYSFKTKEENFSFTLSNYVKFFDFLYLKVFFVSLKLAIISTVICLIIGFPIANTLSHIKKKKQGIYSYCFYCPSLDKFSSQNLLLDEYF